MPDSGFNFKYDRTLKDILKSVPKKFVEILTGKKAIEFLDTNFPKVEELKADLLVKLEGGDIFHLELQTANDSLISIRMLKYYTHLYQAYNKEPIQTVLYIGNNSLNMPDSIRNKHLSFDYELKDIKDINCVDLLNSDDLNDNILSILCKTDDAEALILEITSRISKLNKNDIEDYKLKLKNLLHLRPDIIKIVKELEENKMPITINLEDDPFYLEGKAKGEAEGEAKGKAEGEAKGKAEGMSAAKKTYVINSYKNLNLSPKQIASIVNDTAENVIAILKEDGIY